VRRTIIVALAAILFLAAMTGDVFADLKPADHTGFFIGLGVGGGSLKPKLEASGYALEDQAEGGGVGNVYLGGAVGPRLLLGLDVVGWTKQFTYVEGSSNVTWTFANTSACIWYYPTEYFFLKGGPSLATADLQLDIYQWTTSHTKNGFGFTLGAGGELRLTDKFAIVPQAQFWYQSFSDFFGDLGDVPLDVKTTTFAITVGVGWYW
jgi:opacity protein-like surface antigen